MIMVIMASNSMRNGDFEKTSALNSNFFELTNYLKIYYDFAYFLCISPFRLVFVRSSEFGSFTPGEGKFLIKSWWPQKIFCGVLTLLGLTWLVRDVRLALPPGSSSRNPSVYFGIMLGVVGAILKLAVIRVFWMKQEEICEIVNFLKSSNKSSLHGNKEEGWQGILKKMNIGIFLVCLIYTGIALVNWILGRGLSVNCYEGPLLSEWNVGWWWGNVVGASRYNIFLETGKNGTVPITSDGVMKLDTFLGVIGSLGFYYRRVLGSHCNCFLLMAILTLWTCTRQFSKRLSRISDVPPVIIMETAPQSSISNGNLHPPTNNWDKIHRRYSVIKQLTKMINSVYSLNVTMFLVEAILYYAVSFDDIFIEHSKQNDATKVLRILFYFGSTCTVLLVAADVSRQITSSFKEWLSLQENRKNILADQLYMVLNELDTNTVAIKASNVYPVTYSLAAKLLGVTVTYFIICVQV